MNIPSTTAVKKSHWWKLRYITNIFSTVLDSKDNLGLPIRRSTKDTLSRLAAQICWTIKSLGAILPFYLCVPCKIQLNNFKYIHSGPRSVSLLIQITFSTGIPTPHDWEWEPNSTDNHLPDIYTSALIIMNTKRFQTHTSNI